ncbi:MAG: acetyl-CoA C-acetyltransferase [Rhodospirillaceae bacterium]|nr:MAG: acetyl-CoA C-acetyltransferase [Rhodospirillaceae bacterium]
MTDIVIAGGARTPVGRFNGALSSLPPTKLAEIAVTEAIKRAKIDPTEVDELIHGLVLQGNTGAGPARQVAIYCGLRHESTAYAINQLCASGMRAIAEGCKSIKMGESKIVVGGGMESMSWSPHIINLRNGVRMGEGKLLDSMLRDGLMDPFGNYHMGNTAENVATRWKLTREEIDTLACASQNKAEAAQKAGRFKDEIVPVTVKEGRGEKIVDTDEHPIHGTTMEKLAKLKPAFSKDGPVTAGNSSGINDGAAAVVLMTAEDAARRGITPLARIVSWATHGVDPAIMGIGPVPASRLALQRAGWTVDDLDLIEANEAFGAQAVAVNKEMGWDLTKVNVNGGAIALGHPIGASGCRIILTLVHEMIKRGAKKGIATACVGGGMGIAMCVER